MRRLLDEMIRRPLEAFISSAEMFYQRVEAAQIFDAAVSRFVHTLSRLSRPNAETEPEAGESAVKDHAEENKE
jgi:hypothetical protein